MSRKKLKRDPYKVYKRLPGNGNAWEFDRYGVVYVTVGVVAYARKSKYLWAALAASLCLIMALLVMLGMSLRRQPLTGTYLCEGLSPGAGTYLVFDEKGGLHPCTRQSGVLSAGTYAEDANGVYVLKGEGLTVPYVTYDGKDSVHFFSVPDTYTYQRISDIPTYINVEKP